ncbi:hypothetical protein ACFL3S_07340 [Gemmatimonadota bacterium]
MARGILAELNRMAKQAAREAERAQRAAERERQAAARRAEQARKAEERAAQQLARGREQERKRLEKEAKEAHAAAQTALVEEKNAELAEIYDEIDTLLQAPLDIADFVDLESLKGTAEHPPFDRTDLEEPIPAPVQLPEPPKPTLKLPSPPTGLSALFGKKKHERSVAAAKAAHERALEIWETTKTRQKTDYEKAVEDHQRREADRLQALEAEKERYAVESRAREDEVAERNAAVDKLIADLGYGVPEAIEEYVSIVLGNSVYPEHFQVKHEFSFDSATAELTLRVLIPPPGSISTIKAYKYTKTKDEISSTDLTQKACKDRYAGAVHQVALRTLHEVFEADRRGLIQTISLEVGTETIDPATGNQAYIPFIATGAERNTFVEFDLSAVVPAATLKHLGASVSKNPFALEAADTSGIRKS